MLCIGTSHWRDSNRIAEIGSVSKTGRGAGIGCLSQVALFFFVEVVKDIREHLTTGAVPVFGQPVSDSRIQLIALYKPCFRSWNQTARSKLFSYLSHYVLSAGDFTTRTRTQIWISIRISPMHHQSSLEFLEFALWQRFRLLYSFDGIKIANST